MNKLESYLQSSGYVTVNLPYPSTSESIEQLAKVHIPQAVCLCRKNPVHKIHFVTHSLGGIVLRQFLQDNAKAIPSGSRLVMLAPPNKGSEVADFMKGFFIYKWIEGPAGQELGTGPESVPNRLKPIDVQVGIIAGDRSLNPVFSAIIPGPDDGKVAVERTKLEEMSDFLVISSTHTFIMRNPNVLRQVVHFLEHGRFDHSQRKVGNERGGRAKRQ